MVYRLQKQHMNMLSSLPMSLDFVRKNSGYVFGLECPDYTTIKNIEGKYEAWTDNPGAETAGEIRPFIMQKNQGIV